MTRSLRFSRWDEGIGDKNCDKDDSVGDERMRSVLLKRLVSETVYSTYEVGRKSKSMLARDNDYLSTLEPDSEVRLKISLQMGAQQPATLVTNLSVKDQSFVNVNLTKSVWSNYIPTLLQNHLTNRQCRPVSGRESGTSPAGTSRKRCLRKLAPIRSLDQSA